MITCLDYVSLEVFEGLAPAPDMLAISIGDHDQEPPANLTHFAAGLRLEFLDCDEVDAAVYGIPTEQLFSARQLAQVVDFVREHHARPQHCRLVIHCRLGSSRSSAVALVARHLTQCDFPRMEDAHFANGHVLRMASSELGAITAPRKSAGPEPHPYLPVNLQI
jgi:predicted protein tyrosine phosphatase